MAKPMWPVAPVMRTRGLLSGIFAVGLVGSYLLDGKVKASLML